MHTESCKLMVAFCLLLCGSCNACDSSAKPSVVLSVIDAGNGSDVDATVTFVHDGVGPMQPEESFPGTYVLSSEQSGTFEVTVTADGYETTTKIYEVDDDGCHPKTIEDTIMMSSLG